MLKVVFLLTLQWALAAAVLCGLWRRAADHARAASVAAALVPPLLLAAVLELLRFDRLLVWDERLLMMLLALFTGSLWYFGFIRVREGGGRAGLVLHATTWTGAWWITLSALLLGAFLLTATWVSVSDFLSLNTYMAGAWRWVWVAVLGATLGGGLLTAVALAGTLEPDPPSEPAPEDGSPLPLLLGGLVGAIVLRILALTGSLVIWARFCPFGQRHFFFRLAADGAWNLIALRILLGFILPLLFALLAITAWQTGARRQATAQFFPVLVLALISELIAAALTVGLGGIAF